MTLPSLNLLSQSILSGIFLGGMYGLVGLGLGLSWGLLRQINLTHFGFVFLSAYLCYHMTTVWGIDPLLTLLEKLMQSARNDFICTGVCQISQQTPGNTVCFVTARRCSCGLDAT